MPDPSAVAPLPDTPPAADATDAFNAADPQPVPDDPALDDPSLYFNRELSWLNFDARILHMARDARTPLLERLRFLGIAARNLDDFFRKRVGGLKRQRAAGVTALSPDGRTPDEQLDLVRTKARGLYHALGATWADALAPALADAIGMRVVPYADLGAEQQAALADYFQTHVYPVLTPLAVDPGRPFPLISSLSLSLAVVLRHPGRDAEQFARVKVPPVRPRWVPVAGAPLTFVPLEDLIAHHAHRLFPGMEVVGAYPFRVARNANVRRDEEEAEDLIQMITERLRERRFASVVRLEVTPAMPPATRRFLARELSLDAADVVEADAGHLLGAADLAGLADAYVPDARYERHMRYPSWTPVVPPRLRREGADRDHPDLFSILREGDVLVHHPYESFAASVQHFIESAASDPRVLAIKQTLYRTSDDSPIVAALVRAAEAGKQVAVLVEVTARFDEERNIAWARQLEDAGVHVAYGLVGLKTHAQAALVVRREEDGIRTYGHVSTGNYNTQTARQYTDFGLLTANRALTHDLTNLFHYLTGYAPKQDYAELIVAPQTMRASFTDLIERETARHEADGDGHIIAKMNELGDQRLIAALYRAAQAGVQVDLVVRGHCRLRPGLPGVSAHVRVLSIVGRFLEHDRVFYFRHGGDPQVYIGSVDWQRSRLDTRVEVAVPIRDPLHQKRLRETLQRALDDRRTAWVLHADGRYTQRRPDDPDAEGYQDALMHAAEHRLAAADTPWWELR